MHIVIIGNGIAGNTAASVIRGFGKQIRLTIVSKETFPLYSACVLPNYLCGEIEEKRVFLKRPEDYLNDDIEIIFGQEATELDVQAKKVFLQDKTISYDKLIMATGSKPLMPPIAGINKEGVFTLKSFADAHRIRNHVGEIAVVIGSGLIGVEASIALKKKGYQVFLLELLDRILPRAFDENASSLLRGILEEHGIRVLTGERVVSILGDSKVAGVITDKRQIKCDTVLLTAGLKPEVELARRAGLELGQLGGIKVDNRMLTSANDIYACGDCVETRDIVSGKNTLSIFWYSAKHQGEVVGHNCVGNLSSYPGSINIVQVDLFGVRAIAIGSMRSELNHDNNVEIIEKNYGDGYLCLIISNGVLVGAQLVGEAKDVGVLLSAIRRQDRLKGVRKAGNSRLFLFHNLWRHKITECMT